MRWSQIVRNIQSQLNYVPESKPVLRDNVRQLQQLIDSCSKVCVLTGAGISTESGVPDYRSKGVGLYDRSNHKPIQHQDFVKNSKSRQRYWARNYVGWPFYSAVQPNISHKTLAEWENKGKVSWLITQNVDTLHTKAGTKKLTELHGCSARVMCLDCDMRMSRLRLQGMFEEYNRDWSAEAAAIAPDADSILTAKQIEGFKVPPCPRCDGPLKPEMTFFGDNVAKDTVELVYAKIEEADALFVVGSSLFVYSGFRFARHAKEQNKPLAILNIGDTRADNLADIKIDGRIGEVLPMIKI